MTKTELIQLYDKSTKERVTSSTVVFEEGDYVEGLYVILSGKAMITKNIKVGGTKKTLEIERIERGEMIGDYCFIFKEKLPYSVVSLYPMRLLCIPLKEVKTKFSDDQLMMIVNSVKIYPKNSDILKIYTEKVKWKKYSQDVTNDIHDKRKLAKFKTSSD